jgi:hypothetical protein
MKRPRTVAALGALVLVVIAGVVWADVRLSVPGDIEPLAYLSPAGPGFDPGVIQDGTWAAVPFYRSPECVPEDFNLMDWFDADLDPADCPMVVEGFAIISDSEGFPKSSQVSGDEVPVWFFEWSELEEAMGDGVLTIGEMESLPSLIKGTASMYEEELHFTPPHEVGHTSVAAHGTLEDGRSFKVLAIEYDLEWQLVRITFK